MTLSIVLATRGRPHLLIPTIERTLANMRHPDTKLVVAIDSDDPATMAVVKASDRVIPSVMAREDSLGEKYNNRLSTAPADVYLAMVDYAPHIVPGFDQIILEAASLYPDGIGVVYNHLANAYFPQINAVTHRLTEMLGGMYPGHFPFWFVDHWLDDIAKMIDRIVVANVVVDNAVAHDTIERREPGFWATLFDAMAPVRVEQAFKVIDAPEFQEPDWRKRMLKGRVGLTLQASRAINQNVRNYDWGAPKDVDERYIRIKQRGEQLLSQHVGFMRGAA